MTDHPITPPPMLVRQLLDDDDFPFQTGTHDLLSITKDRLKHVITQAARWGADQELEACCEWLDKGPYGLSIAASAPDLIGSLRAARRLKSPSLKKQALRLVSDYGVQFYSYTAEQTAAIRRALEALPDD